MPLSLYAATVPSYLQILGSVAHLLDKAEAYCAEKTIAAADILDARLAPDMLPFAYQVKSTAVHSIGAIDGVRKGVFSPDRAPWPESFPALRERVAEAREALAAIDLAELESFIGRDMRFEFGERRLDFTAEDFLLTFAQPNFYFHATTTYAILRAKGIEIGKRDYMGELRLKA
jgi:hypothetical protein